LVPRVLRSKTTEGSVSRGEVLEKLAFARMSKRRSEAIPPYTP